MEEFKRDLEALILKHKLNGNLPLKLTTNFVMRAIGSYVQIINDLDDHFATLAAKEKD
jgi:hypothetical protein